MRYYTVHHHLHPPTQTFIFSLFVYLRKWVDPFL